MGLGAKPLVLLHDRNTRVQTTCQSSVKSFIRLTRKNYINYSKSTKTTYCFIDVSASRRKPSSGLTSGAGGQYVKTCPICGSTGSSPARVLMQLHPNQVSNLRPPFGHKSDVQPVVSLCYHELTKCSEEIELSKQITAVYHLKHFDIICQS